MVELDVGTSRGRVRLWEAGGQGPLVLAIAGAFPPKDQLWWLADGRGDYVFAHLPGFHSPAFERPDISIAAFAAAFDEAMARLRPGRPFIALGVSAGSLVALSMTTPARVVAVEPFFRTQPLWAFHEFLARELTPRYAPWAAAVFDDKDYRPILAALARPCRVVVGDVPLEPRRPMRGLPSLTSAEDRAALGAHPHVTLTIGSGGHDVDRAAIRAALDAALAEGSG